MKIKRTLSVSLAALMLMGAAAIPALAVEPTVSDDFNTVDYVDDMIRNLPDSEDGDPMLIAPAPDSEVSKGSYALIVDGRDMGAQICVVVPLRAVAEALGFTVTWNGDGTITLDDGKLHTDLTIGEDNYQTVTSNGELIGASAPFSLGMAPYVVNGTTYVPLELFNILLGYLDSAEVSFSDGKLTLSTEPAQLADSALQPASPFIDCAVMTEAAKLAGFDMGLPKAPDLIQAIEAEMIQAFYGENGGDMMIRKAVGSGDISGDYNDYAQVKTVDGVTIKGENDTFSLAVWEKDGYTYSISVAQALSQADMLALVASVK